MTQCWPEGALRAYRDGELPAEEMRRVAAHLKDCAECEGLSSELAARAAHVSALMELLPECGEPLPWPGRAARAPHRRRNWAGIALALAAGLALAAYLLPDRRPRGAIVQPAPAPAPLPVAAAVAEVTQLPVGPAVPATTRRVRRVRPTAPEIAHFVALDDEPFESGVIMRMAVKPGNVQADIVFGPDGRARAFRLVNAISKGEYR
jgi:anti-sigma factor RsiW